MTPGQIIRRAVIDQAVALYEGIHDGIGDAAIEALRDAGWDVVRLEQATQADCDDDPTALYRVVERA